MSNNRTHPAPGFLRGLLIAMGLAGLLWSAPLLPSFWRMLPARDATARIVADERFKPGTLVDVLRGISIESSATPLRSELLRTAALVRLRLAEDAMARKSTEEANNDVTMAENSVKAALAISPGDSFLWLMLYSTETNRNGFASQYIRYLDRSYAAGPREGWISIRRNRLALAIFPMLGSGTSLAAISEFAEMVDADFIEDTAQSLMGVGWQNREQLLSALGAVDAVSRQRLYKRLVADGIKLTIPGVPADDRPWR